VDIPERYVWLCLRMDRHVEGFVDAYIGPAQWERAVAAEEPIDPPRLRDEARALLDALRGADLEEDRRRWFRGQLEAIECAAVRLFGEDMTWADEVERCFGVRPERTDTSVFEDVHRRLDAALPGSGSVRDRYNAWDEANAVSREQLVPALERLKDVLGPRAHALAPMPEVESVTYELVSEVPWMASNRYEGGYHSRIEVNADLPSSITHVVTLATHEAYPGHHTERAAKDAHLLRELNRMETSVAISSAPESVVSEGIALHAMELALGSDPFAEVADIMEELGLRFDPAEAHAVHDAERALYATATNAAFMLHEDGATAEEAQEYLQEWDLESTEKSARTVAFLTDPESRAYVSAYPDGFRLCSDFIAGDAGNFSRLLTQQLTTADLMPAST
jgi:hypothetical protein